MIRAMQYGTRRFQGRVTVTVMVVLAVAVGLGVPLAWLFADVPSAPPATVPLTVTVAAPPPAVVVPAGSVVAVAASLPVTASQQHVMPPSPQIPRQRDPHGDQSPDVTDFINAGEVPTMKEVIARLQAAGVHSGLGAFNPPGTRPPLVGLAVPANFELPPGYVRHHQSTDDGQPIEPILMFAPDAQWVDAQGQPVAMPADRVVPPEMAPPGMPIRRIVVPAPAPSGK